MFPPRFGFLLSAMILVILSIRWESIFVNMIFLEKISFFVDFGKQACYNDKKVVAKLLFYQDFFTASAVPFALLC